MIARSNFKPELHTSNSRTKSSWKVYESTSPTLRSKKSFQSPIVPVEVHELVEKLAKVDGVAGVRALAPRAVDIHWIEFELELHPETELDDETWDKIQDLIIDCEWDLRDKTNERWYFPRKTVEKFSKIQQEAKVVSRSKISFSSSTSHYERVKSSSN
jgi:hypothetical protein